MRRDWYEYLKEKIESESWLNGKLDVYYWQGQISFAKTACLISYDQFEELVDMTMEH